MNKKIIIGFIGVLLLLTAFLGCIDNSKPNNSTTSNNNNSNTKNDDSFNSTMEKFVGTWNTSEPIEWYIKPSFTFFSNGSFVVQNTWGTYSISEGDNLELHWDTSPSVYNYSFVFLDDDTLKLTYINTGEQGIYERQ